MVSDIHLPSLELHGAIQNVLGLVLCSPSWDLRYNILKLNNYAGIIAGIGKPDSA